MLSFIALLTGMFTRGSLFAVLGCTIVFYNILVLKAMITWQGRSGEERTTAHSGGIISACIIDRDHLIHTIITSMPAQAPLAVFPPCRLTRDNEYARRSFPAYECFGQDQEQKQHGVCHAKKA